MRSLASCRLIWLSVLLVATAGPLVAQAESSLGPVYIAYAGPYASAPPSAFGHLFLVLPADSTQAVPLWDVVSFAATTREAGPFRFMRMGIAGGFDGEYQRLKFHEKSRDYELLDDRDLWLSEVKLSSEERLLLEQAIEQTRGGRYPYTFFEKNCAYYIQLLLADALNGIDAPTGPTSPTGVYNLIVNSGLSGRSYFRPAASRRIEMLADVASPETSRRVQQDDWRTLAADTAWLGRLSGQDRVFIQEFVSWQALRRDEALAPSAKSGVALMRVLNATREDAGSHVAPVVIPGGLIATPAFHDYTRLSLTHQTSSSGISRISLRLRPALHDEFDPWIAHRPLNTMEFLSVELSAATGVGDIEPRMESAVLFRQRSLTPATRLSGRNSWSLDLSVSRHGVLGEGLQGVFRSGVGRATQVGPALFYGLVTTGFVMQRSEIVFSPGVDLGVLVLPAPRWRVGAHYTNDLRGIDPKKMHQAGEAWLRYDLSAGWGARVAASTSSYARRFRATLDFYP